MDAQTLEARIALAQMERYLAGEEFPPDALSELEKVLKTNPVCVAELNRRKDELMDPVAAVDSSRVAQPATQTQDASPKGDWKAKILGLIKPANGDPKAMKMRTLALSVGLGLVLVAMSALLRDPTGLLGPRADATFAATPVDEELAESAPAENADGATAPIEEELPLITEEPEPAAPTAEIEPLPRGEIPADPLPETTSETLLVAEGNEIRQEAAPVQPTPARRPAAPRRPGTGSIRVYDENGRPINP